MPTDIVSLLIGLIVFLIGLAITYYIYTNFIAQIVPPKLNPIIIAIIGLIALFIFFRYVLRLI